MDRDQQIARNIKNQLKSNRGWLMASVIAGLLPISLDFFQSLIPEFIFLGSPVLAWVLIFGLPIVVCLLAVVKLHKWWKLVPIVMLIFNALLIYLLLGLIMWSRSNYPNW